MARRKGKEGGRFMDNGVGLCSYKDNPLPQPRQVRSEAGPGMNPDQKKVNRLIKEAYRERESLRGEGVM